MYMHHIIYYTRTHDHKNLINFFFSYTIKIGEIKTKIVVFLSSKLNSLINLIKRNYTRLTPEYPFIVIIVTFN